MALESMTGFGSATAESPAGRFQVDLRSVNGRSLDIKLRLPPGFEGAEPVLRRRMGERLARGNLQATVTLNAEAARAPVRIDADLFRHFASQARQLADESALASPSTDAILAMRGVVTTDDVEPTMVDEAVISALLALMDEALDALITARRAEGRSLLAILSGHLNQIEALVDAAISDPESQPAAIKRRLTQQIERLLAPTDTDGLDPARLNAEAAMLAVRADIREETDRLTSHVAAARALLAEGGAVGRKLDFLAQEFNREANTLCAKSSSSALTAIGLDLKSAIDQLREQVQNIQ